MSVFRHYIKQKDARLAEGWKDYDKAFPDDHCSCVREEYIPVRCSKCGADRTSDNWKKLQINNKGEFFYEPTAVDPSTISAYYKKR